MLVKIIRLCNAVSCMIFGTKILQLIYEPDEQLHVSCAPVEKSQLEDKQLRQFFIHLRATMKQAKGVGIAAPQVGNLIRACWVSTHGKDAILLINPVIVVRSHDSVWGEEGCLSIPGVFVEVLRAKTVDIEYWDSHGDNHRMYAEDFLARVIQHEIDHLDGVLFTSKARNVYHV